MRCARCGPALCAHVMQRKYEESGGKVFVWGGANRVFGRSSEETPGEEGSSCKGGAGSMMHRSPNCACGHDPQEHLALTTLPPTVK